MKKIIAVATQPLPNDLKELLQAVHIPVTKNREELPWDFCLETNAELGLTMYDRSDRKLNIDFDNDPAYHRKGVTRRSDPLLKALGVTNGRERVWDLTAGLGRDAVMMASAGLQVTSFERNPALFVLLSFAAARSQFLKDLRLRFHFQDAKTVLDSIPVPFPDNGVIYYDPMYPAKKKSALPPQEMVILKELVGADDDAKDIVKKAMAIPKSRLVVKRPDGAPTLDGVGHSIMGKMVRFDVFTHA